MHTKIKQGLYTRPELAFRHLILSDIVSKATLPHAAKVKAPTPSQKATFEYTEAAVIVATIVFAGRKQDQSAPMRRGPHLSMERILGTM